MGDEKMNEYILKLKNLAEIRIYSDIDSVNHKLEAHKSVTKTIPVDIVSKGVVKEIDTNENYITVLKGYEKKVLIDVDKNTAHLFTNMEDTEEFFFPDLVYLAISMFANIMQRKGYYFIQGSVVKYDDIHSVMFIGDPNSGKTSMAFNFIEEYRCSLISNDNVLVGIENNELKTIAGTKPMQMRYGAIKTSFPTILPTVEIDKTDQNRNPWDVKVYVDEYLKNINCQYADDSIVTDIYNIKAYKTGETFIKGKEQIDERLWIYEQLTKQIRSNRYVLVGYDYPIPSFESNEYMQERYNIAKQVTEITNIYDATGTVKELTKRIGKNIWK